MNSAWLFNGLKTKYWGWHNWSLSNKDLHVSHCQHLHLGVVWKSCNFQDISILCPHDLMNWLENKIGSGVNFGYNVTLAVLVSGLQTHFAILVNNFGLSHFVK